MLRRFAEEVVIDSRQDPIARERSANKRNRCQTYDRILAAAMIFVIFYVFVDRNFKISVFAKLPVRPFHPHISLLTQLIISAKLLGFFCIDLNNVCKTLGLNRDLNPGPLAPKARIIPLDH